MSPQTAEDLAASAAVRTRAAALAFTHGPTHAFGRLTVRRAELIRKKHRGELTDPDEISEYVTLQAESRRVIALAFPVPGAG